MHIFQNKNQFNKLADKNITSRQNMFMYTLNTLSAKKNIYSVLKITDFDSKYTQGIINNSVNC